MSTEKKTLLTEYSDFVEQITSDPSNHNDKFQERWDELLQKTRQYKTNLPLFSRHPKVLAQRVGSSPKSLRNVFSKTNLTMRIRGGILSGSLVTFFGILLTPVELSGIRQKKLSKLTLIN